MDKKNNLQWRQEQGHLPTFMRDFHDQKNLFKALSSCFENPEECPINWRDGHIFTIDWFLWFMAIHGYKLQKTTTRVEHRDIDDAIRAGWDYRL